ncbi:MAG: hypothetical protein QM811_13895 [Pirellulales bacterium]
MTRQFTDVTGPGGIHGAPNDDAPLWAMGWDKRSVILACCFDRTWSYYRVPKASQTFDPKHGWYTEWPRIRETLPGKSLMVMHGMMYDFPQTFTNKNTAGIRPIASHLRYIPDFAAFNGKVVLGADETSIMQNPYAGESQSNLQFIDYDQLKSFGPGTGWGSVWMYYLTTADKPSDPYLFAGFKTGVLHLSHRHAEPVKFQAWKSIRPATVSGPRWKRSNFSATGYRRHMFQADTAGEWILGSCRTRRATLGQVRLREPVSARR